MRVPHRENAYVPPSKLNAYLLSNTHPIGKSKSKVLHAVGFDMMNVTMLAQGLLAIAHQQEVTDVVVSPHGTKYVVDGILQAPGERSLRVRTVWILDY